MEKVQLSTGQPMHTTVNAASSSNDLPTKSSSVVQKTIHIPPAISANLHNKNKRKGFKQSMNGVGAEKIVFEDSSINGSVAIETGDGENSTYVHTRITPPSEQRGLPSNIIVTSVDVEAGYWPTQRDDSSSSRKRPRDEYEEQDEEQEPEARKEQEPKEDIFDGLEEKFDNLPTVDLNNTYLVGTDFVFKARPFPILPVNFQS